MEKKDRFQKAYAYLLGKGAFRSKTELAEILGSKRPSVTNAYNGNPRYLTDTFIRRFCAAFPDTFNLDWLLTGEGEMLAWQKDAPMVAHGESSSPDMSLELLRMINDLRGEVNALHLELNTVKSEVAKLQRAYHGYASIAADGGGN